MKKSILYLLLVGSMFLTQPIFAQVDELSPHGGAAKVLFLDHGLVNDVDSVGFTNGIELDYIRKLNKSVNLSIPLKVAVADIGNFINNRTLVSLDATIQVPFVRTAKGLSVYALGGGGFVIENFEDSNLQFPFGLGTYIPVGGNSFITLQGEYRFSTLDLRNNLQFGAGYAFRVPKIKGKPKDRDKDGIPDDKDECPDDPGPITGMGCPDADGDGITDVNDACPDVAGELVNNGCPDTDGDGVVDKFDKCPEEAGLPAMEGCPAADSDGDGLADDIDQCPNEAGLEILFGCPDADGDGVPDGDDKCPNKAGDEDSAGCPDSDGDGLADHLDNCPNRAGEASNNGCPVVVVAKDSDNDGVLDKDDRCPTQAGPSSNFGCPQVTQEVQTVLAAAASNIQFETGSANLLGMSYPVLDQVVSIMRQYPGYSLSIGGHTDSQGNDANNMALSERRSLTCFNYLVSKGIERTRMSYAGYGETRPVADNATVEGRAMNRRVEFRLFVR